MADSWVASMIPNYLLFAYSCFACRAKLVQDVIWGRKISAEEDSPCSSLCQWGQILCFSESRQVSCHQVRIRSHNIKNHTMSSVCGFVRSWVSPGLQLQNGRLSERMCTCMGWLFPSVGANEEAKSKTISLTQSALGFSLLA